MVAVMLMVLTHNRFGFRDFFKGRLVTLFCKVLGGSLQCIIKLTRTVKRGEGVCD